MKIVNPTAFKAVFRRESLGAIFADSDCIKSSIDWLLLMATSSFVALRCTDLTALYSVQEEFISTIVYKNAPRCKDRGAEGLFGDDTCVINGRSRVLVRLVADGTRDKDEDQEDMS